MKTAALIFVCMLAAATAACGKGAPPTSSDPQQQQQPQRVAALSTPAPPRTRTARAEQKDTNIHAGDYVGPEVCGTCHPDEHARWQTSLHRRMNQRAGSDSVIGDFAGARVPYAGGELRLDHDGSGYTMTTAKGAEVTRYRVTRTIGLRGLQEYVGIEDGQTEEVRLPFGWWPRLGRWVPQVYFDPWLGDESKFDAYKPVREPWAERCPWCHSTYPFDQRIARASAAHHKGRGLEHFFVAEPQTERLAVEEQVTTGISCESCHLGGKDHVAGGPIDFVPRGAVARPDAPQHRPFADEIKDADLVNLVCMQCHSGPSPKIANGASLRNSAEARDLEAGKCRGLSCIACHDPHSGATDDARSIATCTTCHAKTAGDPKHAHHKAASASCLDCHMPKIVLGIDHYVRSHRISSPTNIAEKEPNACNLCHLDKTLAWTADALVAYGVTIPHDSAWPAGDIGTFWLTGPHPLLRTIAAFAYARSPLGTRAKLEPNLQDKYPYVRTWTKFAIEELLHKKIDVPGLVH